MFRAVAMRVPVVVVVVAVVVVVVVVLVVAFELDAVLHARVVHRGFEQA
jgi:hypothetical protein